MLHPGQQLGSYRLASRISRGGMGEVWRAIKGGEGGWEKAVALKLILPTLDEEHFAKLFAIEAGIAASLDHANIVPVFHFGRADAGNGTTLLYIEMEQVVGQDLRRVVARQPLPVPLALFVTAEMLKGLAYAHERGVVHRDIKPHNTLCSYEGHVKLTDFGIAKLAETGSGASNSEIKGTVGYIAPEVLEGAQCSPRSDLFAIGLVLWECLTGHKLFDGTTDAERIKRTFDCRVPPLRTVVGTASLELEELTIRLLAREPSARFASAREALTMLLAIPGARAAGSEEMKQFLADIFKMEAEAVVKISRRSSKGLQLPTPPTVSAPIRPLPSVIIDLPELLSDGVPRAVAVEETRVLSRPDNRTPTVAGESSPSAVRKRRQWAGAVVVAAVGLLGVLWATGSGQEHPAATPVMVRPEPSVVPDASIPDAAPLPDAAPPDAAPPSQPRRHRKPAPIVPAAAAPPEPVKRVDDDDGIALPPAPL